MFSVVNVYLDHYKFVLCVLMVEGVSVVVNLMSPPLPGATYRYALTVVKLFTLSLFALWGKLGFLNCDDIGMCVVNKQFELLEFVFDSAQ